MLQGNSLALDLTLGAEVHEGQVCLLHKSTTCVFTPTEVRGVCSKDGFGERVPAEGARDGKKGRMSRWRSCVPKVPTHLHAPSILGRPHTIIQHNVPLDSVNLVLGRQTGWTRGDQAMGTLSFRRAMSLDMKFLKFW